jgi:poly-gamma-glutamate synthesis protein (capsule biosynthesis protein)
MRIALATLERVGIKNAGAGRNLVRASTPAVLEIEGKGCVIVFAFASVSSGVPRNWAATHEVGGANLRLARLRFWHWRADADVRE